MVHHGGAGTTAAGLRAGVPTIIVPFGGDQPYWGDRVYQLGAGPKPIPRKKLDAKHLSTAILQAVSSRDIIADAKRIGEKLLAEDGAGKAADIIEREMKERSVS